MLKTASDRMFKCDIIAWFVSAGEAALEPTIREDLLPSERYDLLPECIKAAYTPEQYAWLSDRDKETLVQRETEPEDE